MNEFYPSSAVTVKPPAIVKTFTFEVLINGHKVATVSIPDATEQAALTRLYPKVVFKVPVPEPAVPHFNL